jgi:hypothetical protein
MLNVIKLRVIMQDGIILNVFVFCAFMLSVLMLSISAEYLDVILTIFMQSAILASVSMLSVFLLNV